MYGESLYQFSIYLNVPCKNQQSLIVSTNGNQENADSMRLDTNHYLVSVHVLVLPRGHVPTTRTMTTVTTKDVLHLQFFVQLIPTKKAINRNLFCDTTEPK